MHSVDDAPCVYWVVRSYFVDSLFAGMNRFDYLSHASIVAWGRCWGVGEMPDREFYG